MSTVMFLRLCSRAPVTTMRSAMRRSASSPLLAKEGVRGRWTRSRGGQNLQDRFDQSLGVVPQHLLERLAVADLLPSHGVNADHPGLAERRDVAVDHYLPAVGLWLAEAVQQRLHARHPLTEADVVDRLRGRR